MKILISGAYCVIIFVFFLSPAQAEILTNEPNDPYYTDSQIYNQYASKDLNIPKAWNLTTGDASIVVAVIDFGVDIAHPEKYQLMNK